MRPRVSRLATHIAWLRGNGYGKALCVLPHDGATNDKVFNVSYESALKEAGFDVRVVPNQGRGAASFRIEAARRRFPQLWINEATTRPGLEASENDWASHAADAFGLMAVDYETPTEAGFCRSQATRGSCRSDDAGSPGPSLHRHAGRGAGVDCPFVP